MNKLSKIKKTTILKYETCIMKYQIAISATPMYMQFIPAKLLGDSWVV